MYKYFHQTFQKNGLDENVSRVIISSGRLKKNVRNEIIAV